MNKPTQPSPLKGCLWGSRKPTPSFFSIRIGGVSPAPYDALNLAFHVGDDPKNVRANRKILAQALGIVPEYIITGQQVHSANIAQVTGQTMRGQFLDHESGLEAADAMITNVPGICLMILVADCVPILLFDPVKKAAGAVHAGWRGTAAEIADKTVMALKMAYGSDPRNILAVIGPSIGPDCYEVGAEVIEQVEKNLSRPGDLLRRQNGRTYFNLWRANKDQLLAAGLSAKNIEVTGICSHCRSYLFFSVLARAGQPTGRFGAGIILQP